MGYTADEIIGKHVGIFYRPDERREGEPNRALEMAIQKDKCEVEGWRIRKNGTLFFVTGSISSIRDESGTLLGFANVLRDSTERRDAQEKLVQAREQLAMMSLHLAEQEFQVPHYLDGPCPAHKVVHIENILAAFPVDLP